MNFKRYQFLKNQTVTKLKAVPRCTAFNKIEDNYAITEEEKNKIATEDSLMLAYIGDSVFSLYIREQLVITEITKVQILHNIVTEFICAKSQAVVLHHLEEIDTFVLTDIEKGVIRRARNSHVNVPKSATVQEYRSSTAFEALLGYLYKSEQFTRLVEIMNKAFEIVMEKQHG